MRYDVAIVGGGVVGCAVARELSRYELRAVLLEATEDVAMGSSKANSAIVHAGYDCKPGSLMARLNVRGNALFTRWCEELEVPLSRCGSLVIGFDEADRAQIEELYAQGVKNGVPDMQIVDGNRARELEPSLSDQVTCALYAPTGGITCPYELTIACSENARRNGVELRTNTPVSAVEALADGGFALTCGGERVEANYVVNAAGLFSDDIARMMGDASFSVAPRKGEYLLMDRNACHTHKVVFQTPSKMGKGVLVSPTVDGNIFAGPTALDQTDRYDTEVTQAGIDALRTLAVRSVPTLNFRAVITSFAGLRAVPSTGDFVIRPCETAPHMVHAAGICSPGLSSAPAIAEEVAGLLRDQGLELREKADFEPHRSHIPAFRKMTREQQAEAIAQNPLYGRIICRCETITEAEIVEAIRRGARSVDGVKRRTRAGMGRCQGGFCSPRVMDILSRELQLPMEEITKFGGHSNLVVGKLKEVKRV